jgi:hypothetical protein
MCRLRGESDQFGSLVQKEFILVVVDHAGIARTAKRLGGEGTNVLLLKTSTTFDGGFLDQARPPDDGESPANGGWFAGPHGWMLLVEGLPEVVDPWVKQVASSLADRGVEGTLTGAGVSGGPAWARRQFEMRSYHALFGFRPKPGSRLADRWVAPKETLDWALAAGTRWLTEADEKVMAYPNMQASMWVSAAAAASIMADDLHRNTLAMSTSYDEERLEVRMATLSSRAALDLGQASHTVPWQDTVEALRAALTTAPLKDLSIAMVTHRSWDDLLDQGLHEGDPINGQAYARHPERWHELTLDPCGIQILTNHHLAVANDLSAWRTTRLDDDHVLVEARDLEPWFASPPGPLDTLDPALLRAARADFGVVTLSPSRAEELGLHTMPDPTKPLM